MDYISNTEKQLQEMLASVGASSFDDLIGDLPQTLRQNALSLPNGLSESQVLGLCEELSSRNQSLSVMASFLGAGSYNHIVPTAVDAIAARGEWLTPYTPYQAEASQGTLQAIYEFQSMVCELMQMDIANASLYDGASGVAEAVALSRRATERNRVLISEALHPHAREVVATYVRGTNTVLQEIPAVNGVTDIEALGKAMNEDVACVLMQQPNVFGCLEPMSESASSAHRFGALFVASVYPISLGLLRAPGSYGADIAVAEGRCLGSPVSYGGPALGLFAAAAPLLRRIPGRLVGSTVDSSGQRGFSLTLQTREQHIRRERASSNICTNEGLLALRAAIFMSLLGPHGMKDLAVLNLEKAHYAKERLCELSWIKMAFDCPFFNEFTLRYDPQIQPDAVNRKLARQGIIGGFPLARWYPALDGASLWCVTETISAGKIDLLIKALRKIV